MREMIFSSSDGFTCNEVNSIKLSIILFKLWNRIKRAGLV
jgi:hypothetical protein